MSNDIWYLILFGLSCFLLGVLVAQIVYGRHIMPPKERDGKRRDN